MRFAFCWFFVFALACGLAALWFTVMQTMSGRHMETAFNPFELTLALLLFSLTGGATYRYLKTRETRTKRQR